MTWNYVVLNIPAIVCFCVAAYMGCKGKDGWGWFLFVGFLIIVAMNQPH